MLRSLKTSSMQLAQSAGLMRLLQRMDSTSTNGLYVLAYHRVDHPEHRPWLDPGLISASPDQFAAQMALLARWYNPVTLPQVLAAVQGGPPLPPQAVLVTVDDGYRDFAEVIFPTASRQGIYPVLFVPTTCHENGVFWWDRIYQAINFAPASELIITRAGATSNPPAAAKPGPTVVFFHAPVEAPQKEPTPPDIRLSLKTPAEKRHAIKTIVNHFKGLPFAHARQEIERIYTELAPVIPQIERSTLNWDELRALARAGASIAAHTHTHPILSRVSLEDAIFEIHTSQQMVQEEIGTALPVFAFPDGKPQAYTAELVNFLSTEGFKLVFTMVEGRAHLASGKILLPRLAVWSNLTLAQFHWHLTPAYRGKAHNLA